MSEENVKARAFLERLRANPSLQGLNILQVEEQLLQFLHVNGDKLYPTLASPAFFNGKSKTQVFQILHSVLKEMTDEILVPELDQWISKGINLSFLRHFDYTKEISTLREALRSLMLRMKDHELCRRNMTGPYSAVKNNLIERYLIKTVDRQRYVAFEFRKIERLKMSPEEMGSFISLTTLFRPLVLLFIADKQGAAGAFQSAGIITSSYGEKVKNNLKSIIPVAPAQLLSSIVNSWISFQDSNRLEASSRFNAIFANRGMNYRSNQVIDRGAETSDKSWFSIARKNYKYMGFDLDMIVELYTISAENGW